MALAHFVILESVDGYLVVSLLAIMNNTAVNNCA